MRRVVSAASATLMAISLGACVHTEMQGCADLDRPAHPIEQIAAVGPPAFIKALSNEAAKQGLALDDANALVPPTRQYKDAEIRRSSPLTGSTASWS